MTDNNVLEFPTRIVTVEDILERLNKAVAAGEVQHLMFVTMGPNTNVKTVMSTIPAHCAVYMNQLQRLSIEDLLRDGGLVP